MTPLPGGAKTALVNPALQNIQNFFNFHGGDAAPEKARLFWLVRMRWLFMAFVTVLTPFAWSAGFLGSGTLVFYAGLLILLFIINWATQTMWLGKERHVSVFVLHGQLLLDLVVLTTLLLLTGGLSNPFWILIFINIVLGAILLSGEMSFFFQVSCHLCLFVLQFLPSFGESMQGILWRVNGTLYIAQHLVLFMLWAASRSFGRYLQLQQKSLLQVQVFAEKMDRLRALGALTAGFSHEFATPLNTIKLRLDREMRNQKDSSNLAEMQKALLECEAVIRQMNSAQMDPREYRFQVIDLVSTMQDLTEIWLRDHEGVEIQIQKPDTAYWVKVPELNFAQMFLNLLDNAYEASDKTVISVEIQEGPSALLVQVRNSGSQFDKDVLERFGEPFVTTKSTGTGLGLYTAHLFMQSLGGSVKLSNLEYGAVVELHFPASLKNQEAPL